MTTCPDKREVAVNLIAGTTTRTHVTSMANGTTAGTRQRRDDYYIHTPLHFRQESDIQVRGEAVSTMTSGRPGQALSLDSYRLLGCSGLRVSPLALGTMTFGSDWGWGTDRDETKKIFDAYVDRGGNFIDTANAYTNGTAEQMVGEFARSRRDQLVIATKYTMATRTGDPNSGGTSRKSMVRSVEGSLSRLQTDYIDLLYLHIWDGIAPVEEVLRAMDDLVRAGKVLYVGMSDIPAWQVSRMQAIAELRGWVPLIALEIPYNLVERTVERDLIPMAETMGLGVICWSPLAGGVLTGKYNRSDLGPGLGGEASSRKQVAAGNGFLTSRALDVAETVKNIAAELGTTPSRVALAWTLLNPAVTAPIVGARSLTQLEDNLGALDVSLAPAQQAGLDEISAIELGFPHDALRRLGFAR